MPRHSIRHRRGVAAPASDVLFGLNPVSELLRASPQTIERLYVARGAHVVDRVAAEARTHGVPIEVVERESLDGMTGGAHHQGIAARTKPFAYVAIEDLLAEPPRIVVVLDGVQDPQNLGAIVRTVEVLAAGAVVLPKDRSVGVTPAVVRASSGAAVHVPIAQVVNVARALEDLKAAGYWIVGLDAEGSSRFQELPSFERVALVVGSEGDGIRPLVMRACDFVVAIPVRGKVASLNVATAAAIGIHELSSRVPRTRWNDP